jgi:hypothetical protein
MTEVPARKQNRVGQMQARLVSVDPDRLHILVRKLAPEKPGGKAFKKSYDMISRMELGSKRGPAVSLGITCRDIETDKIKRLLLSFASAADSRCVHDLCERALVTRETKPFKQARARPPRSRRPRPPCAAR